MRAHVCFSPKADIRCSVGYQKFPTHKVDVVARAPGFIEECTFAEGQEVKGGDLSFWSNKKRMRRGLTDKMR